MGFFSSFKKSAKLSKISKILGKLSFQDSLGQGLDGYDLMKSMRENSNDKDKAREELFDLCENDKQLSVVISNYKTNRKELDEIYTALELNGAGQWARGHYCAASAFAFVSTLEYILEHKDNIGMQEAFVIVDYFERGKLGKV
jgi:hypothetical protein